MTALDVVRSRRSVRTFDGKPLSNETRNELLHYAESTQNPFNLPITWTILNAKELELKCPVITGCDWYIAGKLADGPHIEEAFGFAFEDVVLHAIENGIGTTWIAGTMDRPAFEKAIGVTEGEVMPAISPIGRTAEKYSLKESIMRKGIHADTRLDFGTLFFKGNFDTPLTTEEAGTLSNTFEMVRWAPSAVNKQPWRLVLDGNKIHFFEKKNSGLTHGNWDVQKVDMGIALYHFVYGLNSINQAYSFSIEDPNWALPADTLYIATLNLL